MSIRRAKWLRIIVLVAMVSIHLPFAQSDEPTTESTEPVVEHPKLDDVKSATADVLTIDLETAWRLAGVQNPEINRAKMLVAEARALQKNAALVWFPNLSGGANYRYHDGAYQSSFGQIRDLSMQSAYVGAGSFAIGGGSPIIPGVRLFTNVSDAFYEPLAARQITAVRQSEAKATSNNLLLMTTTAYLELLSIEARLEAMRQTYDDVEHLVDTTAAYAKTGQGRGGDAHRAEAEGFLIVVEFQRLEEELNVRAADLSRRLHLDPATPLRTPGGPLSTFDLVDVERSLSELCHVAERFRPEMSARTAAVAQSQTRIRQEKMRPLLPTISAGFSAGGFGGTGNFTPTVAPFNSLKDRADFDLWAFWTLRNAGLGNAATINQRRAEFTRSVDEREQMRAQIRSEVSEAYATAIMRRRQLTPALRRIQDSEAAFRADYNRLRSGEGLPLEALNSVRLLATARQELVTTVIADTIAQFRLFVALGKPPYCADGWREGTEVVPSHDEIPFDAARETVP